MKRVGTHYIRQTAQHKEEHLSTPSDHTETPQQVDWITFSNVDSLILPENNRDIVLIYFQLFAKKKRMSILLIFSDLFNSKTLFDFFLPELHHIIFFFESTRPHINTNFVFAGMGHGYD